MKHEKVEEFVLAWWNYKILDLYMFYYVYIVNNFLI